MEADKKNRTLVSNFVPSPPNPTPSCSMQVGGAVTPPLHCPNCVITCTYKTSTVFRCLLFYKKHQTKTRLSILKKIRKFV